MNYSELKTLSIEELRELNSKVVELIKIKKSEIENKILFQNSSKK